MLKNELIDKIQEKLEGKTKKECGEFIDAFEECVTDALARNEEVKLVNFGTFKVRKIKAHEGVDPTTKNKIKIKDIYIPFFKVGKGLKDSIARK